MLTARVTFLWILVLASLYQASSAATRGTRCTRSTCSQERGFIEYRRGGQITQWTLRGRPGQYTTFVLHFKNLLVTRNVPGLISISQGSHTHVQTHTIDNNDKRLFVFRETNHVTITVMRYHVAYFQMDFYVGCSVLEGSDITMESETRSPTNVQAPPNSFYYNFFYGIQQHRPECWFIIPSITEEFQREPTAFESFYINLGYPINLKETRTIEVQQTYLTLQNITMSNETTLNVMDLMQEEAMMSVEGSDVMRVLPVMKSNATTISYLGNRISTLIFIDLVCQQGHDCEQTAFLISANAMQQSDVDCMEREQKCRFNLGDRDFDCTPPTVPPIMDLIAPSQDDLANNTCRGFNRVMSNIMSTINSTPSQDEEEEEGSGEVVGRGYSRSTVNRCTNYGRYCSVPCTSIRRYCWHTCWYMKVNYMCRYLNNIF